MDFLSPANSPSSKFEPANLTPWLKKAISGLASPSIFGRILTPICPLRSSESRWPAWLWVTSANNFSLKCYSRFSHSPAFTPMPSFRRFQSRSRSLASLSCTSFLANLRRSTSPLEIRFLSLSQSRVHWADSTYCFAQSFGCCTNPQICFCVACFGFSRYRQRSLRIAKRNCGSSWTRAKNPRTSLHWVEIYS